MTTSKLNNAFATSFNPLRGLTLSGINSLVENIKRGNDVKLLVAFAQMEQIMPIFGVCISKRLAGITGRKWDVVPYDSSEQSASQAKAVKEILLKSDSRNLDGLTEAIRHLGLASFRGRSCVKPFVEGNEIIFKKISNWNTLQWNDKLYWNPEADLSVCFIDNEWQGKRLEELSEDEVCWIKEERPIDIPGLQIYLRQAIGEENWARATEKYGVAQVVITTPDGTTAEQVDDWTSKAIALFEGGSGVLPPGANVTTLTDARGQDPFSEYCKHQEETIVLLALGEKLTTLGGSTGMGSNLAEVLSNEFLSLVNYDCKRIANAITRCVVKKICREILHANDVLCKFDFVENDKITAKEYLEMAQMVKNMGMEIDVEKLKEMTNMQFIDTKSWSPAVSNGWTRKDAEEAKADRENQ